MVRILILLFAAVSASAQTATISDSIVSAVGGQPWAGRITVSLGSPGSAQPLYSGTTSLAGWSTTVCLGVVGPDCDATAAAGVFSLTLWTNSAITPGGTSYVASFQSDNLIGLQRPRWTERWIVANGNTKLYQIRSTVTPTPNLVISLNQLAAGGATNGQVPAWNGSAWVPTSVGGGTTYTASAVIDLIQVPDGACVLDSTAVTVTGAALGGRPTLGSSYQPPEGVFLYAKIIGPNSMKVEICNWSGAVYNAASATYYFGSSQ